MNVMDEKGQFPNPWQCATTMYGGYPATSYSYQQYDPHSYYYYQGGLPYGGMNGHPAHQMMHPMKPFTPGGQMSNFSGNKGMMDNDQAQSSDGTVVDGEGSKDLPPLPPGPPPSNTIDQPSPPGSTPPNYYQPTIPGGGPVRFNVSRTPRPQFNQQAPVFNNSGSAKKKRKKNKNKFNNQQQQSQGFIQQQNQGFIPPMPPHQLIRAQPPLPQAVKAPPLPPGPPPASPQPPPEDIKTPTEPRPFSPKPPQMLDIKNYQDNWPEDLKEYIRRCFAKCHSSVDKDRVSIILKGKIMTATSESTIWIKDWALEPLPMLESDMATGSVHPLNKVQKENSPTTLKKRLSSSLTSRLGLRIRSRSKSRSRSRSRSPIKPRQRSPRSRRRRDKSISSDSENEWQSPVQKKGKGRNIDRSFGKQGNKGKMKEKGQSHFYSEFGTLGDIPVNNELLEKRAARFNNNGRRGKAPKTGTTITITNTNASLVMFEDTTGDFELEDCHIVGVCQDIEKPYLRLTTAPEAAAVRPPDVLRQSLSRVKERWLQNQDYHYACEQLKSIRQDLTVQGIRDKLTVSVYETHARIALEKGDHAEFNQCQSQLKLLYEELPGDNRCEFTAYRILYFIFTKENMDLNTVMTSLSEKDRKDQCISHALNVRSAWALSNYHRLFMLYRTAPRMSSYLMDWFLQRERKLALKTIIKAYRQTLLVSFLTQELAFKSDSLCQEFMSQYSVVYTDVERTKIDCKASATVIANI